jgi:ketosteroid isomerase-like protein
MTDPRAAAVLRAEIDALLADWAWHLDHGDYDAVASLFTEDALFVTGAVELRGRSAIRNRYTERQHVRSTRHTYSGLRVSPVPGSTGTVTGASGEQVRQASTVRAWSTWVNYAVNAAAPVDDVGVYLVADFEDVLVARGGRGGSEAGRQWLIAERRIVPVFRDPSRAPA